MNPIDRFFASAAKSPDAPAIVSAGGVVRFADVADTVRRMANKFAQSGVGKGSVVGVNARPELDSVATLALLQLGAVSMRVSETILRGYRDSIDLVVSDSLPRGAGNIPLIDLSIDFIRSLAGLSPRDEVAELAADDLVRIVFSSGTTGTPKGVPFTNDYLTARVDSARRNWIPAVPFMSLLGLDTVTGYQTFMWAMMNGEAYFAVAGAEANLGLIVDHRVVAIKTSPARLAEVLTEAERQGRPDLSLKVVEVAGSLIPSKTVTECQMFIGVTPTYLYGSTEVGTVTRGAVDTTTPSMVGTIVDEIDVEIVTDDGDPVEAGSEGILRFRKEGMPTGYWNNPVVSNSSGFRDGWFYPGDYGRIDPDNRLWLSGRRDDLVNAGGAKFNLIELDQWLVESGLFLDAASFQFTTETGATSVGVAFVTKHPPEPSILRERLKDFLPDLTLGKLLRVREIPRNQLGKVERAKLATTGLTSKGPHV